MENDPKGSGPCRTCTQCWHAFILAASNLLVTKKLNRWYIKRMNPQMWLGMPMPSLDKDHASFVCNTCMHAHVCTRIHARPTLPTPSPSTHTCLLFRTGALCTHRKSDPRRKEPLEDCQAHTFGCQGGHELAPPHDCTAPDGPAQKKPYPCKSYRRREVFPQYLSND